MESVVLYDPNCHDIQNYVASIQEPFGIVTLATRQEARKYPLDAAVDAIRLVRRVTNGHRVLQVEFVD